MNYVYEGIFIVSVIGGIVWLVYELYQKKKEITPSRK
jgi:hypothetical protein